MIANTIQLIGDSRINSEHSNNSIFIYIKHERHEINLIVNIATAEKLKTSLEQTIQDFYKVKEDSCKQKG